jgi:4-oxalocrotonate tautomerase
MPHIQITLVEGRTVEQKRRIAQRMTDVLVEEAGAKRENCSVAFLDVKKEDFAEGGVLVIDQTR